MLRALTDLPPGVIGFEAVGEVHSDDYRDVLRPAIDAAAAAGGVRLVYVLGPEFTGYSAGADVGGHQAGGRATFSAWERTAVVTDVGLGRAPRRRLQPGWCPVSSRRFSLAERDEAVRWAPASRPSRETRRPTARPRRPSRPRCPACRPEPAAVGPSRTVERARSRATARRPRTASWR